MNQGQALNPPSWRPVPYRPARPEAPPLLGQQAAAAPGGYSFIDSPIASFIVDAVVVSSSVILARLSGMGKHYTMRAAFWAIAAAAGLKGLGDLARMHE